MELRRRLFMQQAGGGGGNNWLTAETEAYLATAFGSDGQDVIDATNAYLDGIADSYSNLEAQALADCINEDNMLVCTLVQPSGVTMPYRWVVGNGSQIFTTSILDSAQLTYDTTIVPTATTYAILGTQDQTVRLFYINGTLYSGVGMANGGAERYANSFTLSVGTIYRIRFDGTNLYVNDTLLGITVGTTYKYATVMWFREYSRWGYFKGKELKLTDPNGLQHFYAPFKQNGIMELIDLTETMLTGTKVFAQRTGTFSEEFTIYDGVTPWTPGT